MHFLRSKSRRAREGRQGLQESKSARDIRARGNFTMKANHCQSEPFHANASLRLKQGDVSLELFKDPPSTTYTDNETEFSGPTTQTGRGKQCRSRQPQQPQRVPSFRKALVRFPFFRRKSDRRRLHSPQSSNKRQTQPKADVSTQETTSLELSMSHFEIDETSLVDSGYSVSRSSFHFTDTEASSTRPATMPVRPNTCQCCYDDISPSDTTSLSCTLNASGRKHYFCTPCTQRYVSEFVFAGASYSLVSTESGATLPCFAGECLGGYLQSVDVEQTLSDLVIERFRERMDTVQGIPLPMTCAEITPAASASTAAVDETYRAKVEEALTEAKIRRCPSCHSQFLKESSNTCNKFKCPVCRTAMCYVCRGEVPRKGYDHFCIHDYDHCTVCTKCPLWTKRDEEYDKERLRQVATDAANRVWEESLLEGSEIRIDVNQLLEEPVSA